MDLSKLGVSKYASLPLGTPAACLMTCGTNTVVA